MPDPTPSEQEPTRCPTCGSDDPAYRQWRVWYSGEIKRERHRPGGPACPDPFHKPVPPEQEAEAARVGDSWAWFRCPIEQCGHEYIVPVGSPADAPDECDGRAMGPSDGEMWTEDMGHAPRSLERIEVVPRASLTASQAREKEAERRHASRVEALRKARTERDAARLEYRNLLKAGEDQTKETQMGEDRLEDGIVSTAVIEAFNPPDDDAAFESICADAIEAAAEFIRKQPCTCDRSNPDPYWVGNEGCERCHVLGRIRDEVVAR